MTLQDMIAKWEGLKARLIAESGSRPTGDIVIVNEVLNDLNSVQEHINNKGGDKMSEGLDAREQHKIRIIEELTCKLAANVGNVLGRVHEVNRFFFGVPVDRAESEGEVSEPTGWFETHIQTLRSIDDRVQDIYNALGNISEVIDKKVGR